MGSNCGQQSILVDMMFKTSLFLGLPVTSTLEIALKQANPGLFALFTKGGPDYLEFYEQSSQRFLGKNLGEVTDLSRIELVGVNIYSLVLRLAPNYPCQTTPLTLITCVSAERNT